MTDSIRPTSTAAASSDDPLVALRRPSGGLAMLAIDQREALRVMMAEHAGTEITDDQVRTFKIEAAKALTPYASAVLIDHQFGWDSVLAAGVVAPGCAVISAADRLEPDHGELVGESTLDTGVDLTVVAEQGAAAAKLLILWREDQPAQARIDLVGEFVQQSHRAGLAAIIEPVARSRIDGQPSDLDAGIQTAAEELGDLGADLYKAQVPFAGRADDDITTGACRRLTDTIASPWVVLSSGVDPDAFPRAVGLAVRAGASGFLAGRAVWAQSLTAPDVAADLVKNGVARLQALGDCVDDALASRTG